MCSQFFLHWIWNTDTVAFNFVYFHSHSIPLISCKLKMSKNGGNRNACAINLISNTIQFKHQNAELLVLRKEGLSGSTFTLPITLQNLHYTGTNSDQYEILAAIYMHAGWNNIPVWNLLSFTWDLYENFVSQSTNQDEVRQVWIHL